MIATNLFWGVDTMITMNKEEYGPIIESRLALMGCPLQLAMRCGPHHYSQSRCPPPPQFSPHGTQQARSQFSIWIWQEITACLCTPMFPEMPSKLPTPLCVLIRFNVSCSWHGSRACCTSLTKVAVKTQRCNDRWTNSSKLEEFRRSFSTHTLS